MRCPGCSFEIQGTPRLCPNCSDTLPAPEWEETMDIGRWVLLGDVVGIITGVVLVVSRWHGALGLGGLLIALSAASLIVSRGGTRWSTLPTAQKVLVGLGALAVIGFALLPMALPLVPLGLRASAGSVAPSYSSGRGREQERGAHKVQKEGCPICGMSHLPGEAECSFCAPAHLVQRQEATAKSA